MQNIYFNFRKCLVLLFSGFLKQNLGIFGFCHILALLFAFPAVV